MMAYREDGSVMWAESRDEMGAWDVEEVTTPGGQRLGWALFFGYLRLWPREEDGQWTDQPTFAEAVRSWADGDLVAMVTINGEQVWPRQGMQDVGT